MQMFTVAGKNVKCCNNCNCFDMVKTGNIFVDVNVAPDNCTGGDDAMAAEEVTGIGSVGNIFEGLSCDNMTPEYKENQCQQR